MKNFQKPYEESILNYTFKGNQSRYEEFISTAANYLETKAPEEYREELKGMARICGISTDYLLAYNFIYELRTLACSTILTCDSKGRMNLTSNLDFCYDEFYSDVTFHGVFTKNGEVCYEGNYIFGFIGFSRGHKNGISAALNARMPQRREKREKGEISQNVEELFKLLENENILQMTYFFRKALEDSKNLEELDIRLGAGILGAPVYFVATDGVSGFVQERGKFEVESGYKVRKKNRVNFGKILNSGFEILAGIYNPGTYFEAVSELLNNDISGSYYVQTNFDQNSKDLDGRRECAIEKVKKNGFIMEREEVVEKIMTKSPNFMLQAMNHPVFRVRTISTCYLNDENNYVVLIWKLI